MRAFVEEAFTEGTPPLGCNQEKNIFLPATENEERNSLWGFFNKQHYSMRFIWNPPKFSPNSFHFNKEKKRFQIFKSTN